MGENFFATFLIRWIFYFVGGGKKRVRGLIENFKEPKKKYKNVGFEVFYRISLKKK